LKSGTEHRDEFARWQTSLDSGDFEDIYRALSEAVECLESGNLPLEDAIQCYELGARLAERCSRILAEAELRVSRLDADLMASAASATTDVDSDPDQWK
jgi:exodeoxyribonuclease VII small subunit